MTLKFFSLAINLISDDLRFLELMLSHLIATINYTQIYICSKMKSFLLLTNQVSILIVYSAK